MLALLLASGDASAARKKQRNLSSVKKEQKATQRAIKLTAEQIEANAKKTSNHSLGVINDEISGAMAEACREIIDGKWHENFPIDMVQGGAGTSVNMNANEVIANRALEILGREKGDYLYVSPNDHCNCGQSTNDVYPTSIRLALIRMNAHLVGALTGLISAFRYKAEEYSDAIDRKSVV